MQLYKNFFKLINANRFSISLYTGIMIVFALCMIWSAPFQIDKNSTNATERSADYKNLGVLYRDNDNSELSNGLRDLLKSYGSVEDDTKSSEESINDILYFNVADYFIEVQEGFQEKIDAGEEVSVDYNSHSQVSGKTFSFVSDVDAFINLYRSYRAMGLDAKASVEKSREMSSSEVKFEAVIKDKATTRTNANEYALYMILLYFTYSSLCILCCTVGATIISANKKNIANRIGASPVKPGHYTWVQMAGLMTFATVLVLFFTIFSFLYAGSSDMMKNYGWAVVLNLITTAFYLCGFTLMISNFNLNVSSLNLISNTFGLSMCFLCGIFVPFYVLSSSVQNFAHILPFFWTGKVLNTIYAGSGMNYTCNAETIFSALGVQVLYGLAFVMIAIVIKKIKQGKAA